jgi:hypothetical protein
VSARGLQEALPVPIVFYTPENQVGLGAGPMRRAAPIFG